MCSGARTPTARVHPRQRAVLLPVEALGASQSRLRGTQRRSQVSDRMWFITLMRVAAETLTSATNTYSVAVILLGDNKQQQVLRPGDWGSLRRIEQVTTV